MHKATGRKGWPSTGTWLCCLGLLPYPRGCDDWNPQFSSSLELSQAGTLEGATVTLGKHP